MMTRDEMIATLDAEISRLEHVRELLRQSKSSRFSAPGFEPGRVTKKTRTLSPEARRRIAQAQKRRWATQRKERNVAGDAKR